MPGFQTTLAKKGKNLTCFHFETLGFHDSMSRCNQKLLETVKVVVFYQYLFIYLTVSFGYKVKNK